jgi:alkylated DNA repair dioxygenase AlkB
VIADADIVRRITDRAQAVLGERVAFNEVLSVLYREGQKMSWHDDGEEGN